MKKILLSVFGVTVFATALTVNIASSFSNNAEIDLMLSNIEAVAKGEIGDGDPCWDASCYGGRCTKLNWPGGISCTCVYSGRYDDFCMF